MKKRSLLLILVLTISLAIPIFLTQTQPVYTQPIITPTQTYQIPKNLTVISSMQVNFTVTTNIGVLIAGNIAGWSLGINATCLDPQQNITGITINTDSIINTGIMFPISNVFASDENMTGFSYPFPPFYHNFTLFPSKLGTVYLLPDTVGFPSQLSFNLRVTIETTNGSESIYLASDVPAVSLVLPNPSETPPVINYYTYGSLFLVFLLPITLILTDQWLKRRRLKKESAEEV
nr:hypothetical protein [Candidatus Freyarchaeota archaeon]